MVPLKLKLSEGFLEEEVRCAYTVTKQMKEVWAVELDLAVQLLDVCKRHNIQVFADGGTELGAARHKGFIPWDDDMDFCMLRSEYEKFCKIAPQEFKEPYFFQTAYTDDSYFRGHAQIRNSMTTAILKEDIGKVKFNQGIFIDIFPLDEVYDSKNKFIKQKKRVVRFQKMVWILDGYLYKKDKTGVLKKILSILVNKVIPRDKWYKKYEKGLQEANGKGNKNLSFLCLHMDNIKYLRRKSDYERIKYLPFENIEIPVPFDYENNLALQFGNWNDLVRENSLHGKVYFDTNNSYKKYLNGELRFSE